jgi:hypothetical protein
MGIKTSSFHLDGQERDVPLDSGPTSKVTAYANPTDNSFTVETLRSDGKRIKDTRTLNRTASQIHQLIEITTVRGMVYLVYTAAFTVYGVPLYRAWCSACMVQCIVQYEDDHSLSIIQPGDSGTPVIVDRTMVRTQDSGPPKAR